MWLALKMTLLCLVSHVCWEQPRQEEARCWDFFWAIIKSKRQTHATSSEHMAWGYHEALATSTLPPLH